MMSRPDFEVVAMALRRARPEQIDMEWIKVVETVAEHLGKVYPRFKRSRFLDACLSNDSDPSTGARAR